MFKKIVSFQNFTDKESQNYLADHYPKGKLFANKLVEDSVIYRFILSLSIYVKVFIGDLLELVTNRDISQADELLEEWETSVKIPSETPRRDTTEGRREAIECLISKVPVYNIDDGEVEEKTTFEHYIYCLTGLEVEIRTNIVDGNGSQFTMQFPFNFGVSEAIGNFVFIIGVPVSGDFANNQFPLPFAVNFFDPVVPDATMELLDKLLDRVIPSFCRWEYEAITT